MEHSTRSTIAGWRGFGVALLAVSVIGGSTLRGRSADLTYGTPASAGLAPNHLAWVDAQVMKYVQSNKISGGVVLIARRGQIAYLKAYGLRDLEAGWPMETNTLFRIASMSKLVTSVGMMLLIEAGAAHLDDPVSKFIPEFASPSVIMQGDRNRRTRPATREITIRHLLTHTSGITYRMNERFPLSTMYTEAGVCDGLLPWEGTIGEMVRVLARQPLWFNPGTAWEYGLSTDVLGYLIEVVSGMPLDRYLRERLFEPLGMNDTRFHVPDDQRGRLAAVYAPAAGGGLNRIPDDPPVVSGNLEYSPSHAYAHPGTYFSGGGGLVSTAVDYARLLQMLLNGGELNGHHLLSASGVRSMTTNAVGSLGANFGLGSVGISEISQWFEWPGSWYWGGFWTTSFQVDPVEQVVLVLLTQLFPGDRVPAFWEDFNRAAYEAINEPRLYVTGRTGGGFLHWRLSSLVPKPGRQLLPGIRLLQSADFEAWQPVVSANPMQSDPRMISRVMPRQPAAGFFKLEQRRDFSRFNLSGARLASADLRQALLREAMLEGADLTGADLRGADLTGAIVRGAKLTEANLLGAVGFDDSQEGIVYRNTLMPDGSVRGN
ncbi:MAG: serine hydrolase [Verrucomicrobiales bacterium]|nr:serine hydrolase [Verrucomicrobiales bacterium]